jgi:hypothetical protein
VAQNKPFKLAQVAHFGEDRCRDERHEERIQSIQIHDSHYQNAMVLGVTMKCLVQQHRYFFDINQYSDLRPVKRILALVLHFVRKVRQRLDKKQLGI